MNVSMQDTYNLGWKIGAVITGLAKQSILDSYQTERHQVALDLIATDQAASSFYSQNIANGLPLADGAERETLQAFRERHQMFLSGVTVDYSRSMLTASADGPAGSLNAADWKQVLTKQYLAPGIKIGMRLPSSKVLNQAEARPVHLAELLKSDGRWRVIVFAGDLSNRKQFQRLQQLGESLAKPTSFVHTYTRSHAAIDSVIEILVVHSAPRHDIELLSLHEIFHPRDENLGWDYWKVFADDFSYHEGFSDAYGHFGIDRNSGCSVVCRPDQHVGYIGALEDVDEMGKYFSTMLISQR
jgi:phenol 2-monooxygenase (NADPH)